MKEGSLVRIKQSIKAYREAMGEQIGVVISTVSWNSPTQPNLLQIYWPDGDGFENLYEDEVESVQCLAGVTR